MTLTVDRDIRDSVQTSALVVDGVGKTYGEGASEHEVLRGLTLRVEPGEFVCIVGPSGAGKTTLLRCLSGLIHPTTGTVHFGNKLVTEPQSDIAVVFQDYRGSLLPWMKVRENVAFPLEGRGIGKEERRRRADASLAAVGLPDVGDKYPWQLSGGMQQRVSIARGLACHSKLLVMDEPFGSVDAQARFELEDLILTIRRDVGISIVVVTHDIDEAVYLSDRVVVLAGKPATVVDNMVIDLGADRDQLVTRADPKFATYRSHVLEKIRGTSSPA